VGQRAGGNNTSANLQDPYFGDKIKKKSANTLRVGFQNIGGFSLNNNSYKDELIREGINTFDFDIMGLAEMNTNWRMMDEQSRLP
jgi:hypothetical protein